MSVEAEYKPISYIYRSRGLYARWALDESPEYSYLDMLNCLERGENEMSSRFGTQIINRDPNGTIGGQNYYFTEPVITLARLNYQNSAYRYAGLSDGSLHRRTGNTQGPYTRIAAPGTMSGDRFSWCIQSCYETAQPYIFFYDPSASLKDSGTFASPQLIGIDAPAYTANTQPYSPLLTLIDDFASGNAYAVTGFSGAWSYSAIGSIPVNSGSIVTDFTSFLGGTTTATGALTADNTLTVPPFTASSTSATAQGFADTPISPGESVTIAINDAQAVFALTGTATGSGTVQFQYSINNGTTWISFYSQSFSAQGTFNIGTISTVVPGIGNLNTLQYRILATSSGTGGAGNVVMNASCVSTIVAVSVAGQLADVTNGMLSVLAESGTNVAVASTIPASQHAAHISPAMPSTSYEYNAPQIRTRGGVPPGTLTEYVIATGFGLNVPLTATINGIKATLNWVGQEAGTGTLTNAALYYANAIYGTVQTPGTPNSAFSSNTDIGGDSFLWGAAPTPAIVNDPTFGIGTQVTTHLVGSTDRSFFNSWTITVYYSTSGGGGGATSLTSVPIASVVSSGWDGSKYTTLTIVTGTPHGIAGGSNVSVYGCTNDLCDGFYAATAVNATTLTVPFISVSALSGTGGSLRYYPGQIPSDAVLSNIYSTPWPPQFSAFGFYQQVPTGITTFPIGNWSGTVDQNETATVGVTADFDLSINNQVTDDDLIVLTLKVGNPNAVSNIRLQFDVNDSGYSSSYYYKDISPAYYQPNVASTESAYDATQSQVLADALGLLTAQPPNSTTAQLQPGNLSTGADAWQTVYLRRGDFVPVGNAGDSGLDWGNISGWQLTITTATDLGSTTIACNGLYLQWGYGPSSFGGVGYDYRYTYYDVATGTESSPSPIMQFGGIQFGYLASLAAPIYLRQAAQLTGQYSADPQVTHLRIYRRGGTYSSNWFRIDQVPNITNGGPFSYKDVVPDAILAQASPLVLDNDPPVTAPLLVPISTTLSASTSGPGNSYYSLFSPQTITVADTEAVFVPEQIVDLGYATNLEQVTVITGGTGSFTAMVRLQHNAGEPVNVYAQPRAKCNLCAVAYNQTWLAGDKNNPHYLYFSKPGLPENFGPQNYIAVSTPDDPIVAVINWRGVLVVGTLKTWYTINGGSRPYPVQTGSQHGIIASFGWTVDESGIWFRSVDGLRVFTGAEGQYVTLPVEWIYQGNPQCIPPQADQTKMSNDILAYYNNQVFDSYTSTSGQQYRMVWNTNYKRFRYDDVPATAMLWEKDINTFLVAKQMGVGQYAVVQDQVGDYDDGGWSGDALVKTPINIAIQTPYKDLGAPNNPKQWNMFETDVNTQGQAMTTTLLFEDGQVSVPLANVTTTQRNKVPLQVNGGDGEQAYRASIRHTMAVTVAPIIYQEDIYACVLADYNNAMDTYWIKFGTDTSKFVKQGYFDYTADAPITVNLYADNIMVPYFTFTLPITSQRYVQRVRFGNVNNGTTAFTLRTWRMIATCAGEFQMWYSPRVEWKKIGAGHSYQVTELNV